MIPPRRPPSPEGKWLAYGSRRGGVRQLGVMRPADRSEQRITDLKLDPRAVNETLHELGAEVRLRWKTEQVMLSNGKPQNRYTFDLGRFRLGQQRGEIRGRKEVNSPASRAIHAVAACLHGFVLSCFRGPRPRPLRCGGAAW